MKLNTLRPRRLRRTAAIRSMVRERLWKSMTLFIRFLLFPGQM